MLRRNVETRFKNEYAEATHRQIRSKWSNIEFRPQFSSRGAGSCLEEAMALEYPWALLADSVSVFTAVSALANETA